MSTNLLMKDVINDYFRMMPLIYKPSTILNVTCIVKAHIIDFFSNYEVEEVDNFVLIEWNNYLTQKGFG